MRRRTAKPRPAEWGPRQFETRRGRQFLDWVARVELVETVEQVAELRTVAMLAAVYGVPAIEVARHVVRLHEQAAEAQFREADEQLRQRARGLE